MTTTIRSSADGSKSYIQVGGTDRVTIGSQGIEAGSYKPGSIAANDFADGALIENAPVGIGYGPGAGGTVTQATSKSTEVTLNKPCGQITMNNASLAAGATVAFLVNNSCVGANDTITLSFKENRVIYSAYNTWPLIKTLYGAGGFYIYLKNISNSAQTDVVEISFAVIKGATS